MILSLLVGPPFILTIYRAAIARSMDDFFAAIACWLLVVVCTAVGSRLIAAAEEPDGRE